MGLLRVAFPIALGAAVTLACSGAYEEAPSRPVGPGDDAGSNEDTSAGNSDTGPKPTTITWLPREGIYRYNVDGRQRLSVGTPEYRDEGPVAPAEIRRAGDCWHFRLCLVGGKCDDRPSAAYSEVDWSFCVAGGRLEERGAKETTRWVVFNDPKLAVSQVTCDPGQALYASTDLSMKSWGHVCQGKVDNNFAFGSSGPYRYLGEEPVVVAGTSVRAFHFSEDRTVTANQGGAPAGQVLGEWWFGIDGLPLRVRRRSAIDTNIGFGVVEFRETAKALVDGGPVMNDCVLDSLEPGPLPMLDASDQ